MEAGEDDIDLVKILVPLTGNHNSPDEGGVTTIFWAAESGNTQIVKILAPLTDNPNKSPDFSDETLI